MSAEQDLRRIVREMRDAGEELVTLSELEAILPPVEQGAQPASDLSALPGPLPYERMAVSNLKALNASRLRTLPHALVVERHSEALAVIVPMDWYSRVVDVLQKQAGLSRPEGTR